MKDMIKEADKNREIRKKYEIVLMNAILDGYVTCYNMPEEHKHLSDSFTVGKQYKIMSKEDGLILIHTNSFACMYLKPKKFDIRFMKIITDIFYKEEIKEVKEDFNNKDLFIELLNNTFKNIAPGITVYGSKEDKEVDKVNEVDEVKSEEEIKLPEYKDIDIEWLYGGRDSEGVEKALDNGYEVCVLKIEDGRDIYLNEEDLKQLIRVGNGFRTDMVKLKKEITNRRSNVNKAIKHVELTMNQLGLSKEEYIDIIVNKIK